jgi:SSS family solute:Na+ symporter
MSNCGSSVVSLIKSRISENYSRPCRDWLAFLSIISAIFIHIGFTLYTGAVVLKGLFGIPIMYSIVGITLLTGLYTIVGGLMAVVVTDRSLPRASCQQARRPILEDHGRGLPP